MIVVIPLGFGSARFSFRRFAEFCGAFSQLQIDEALPYPHLMCGRYTILPDAEAWVTAFSLAPNYNVAPTQDVPIVRNNRESGERELVFVHWGLIPFWAKDIKIGYRMINARAETVAEKPAFAIGEDKSGESFEVNAYELETKIQRTEQGEFWADWGLLFKLEEERDDSAWEFAGTLLLFSPY